MPWRMGMAMPLRPARLPRPRCRDEPGRPGSAGHCVWHFGGGCAAHGTRTGPRAADSCQCQTGDMCQSVEQTVPGGAQQWRGWVQ